MDAGASVMQGEEETIVVDAVATRSNASRAGRVYKPTTRVDQGIIQPTNTTVPTAKTNDTEANLRLILELLRTQSQAIEEQGRKYEAKLEEQGRKYEEKLEELGRKYEAQISANNDRLDALTERLNLVTERVEGLASIVSPPSTDGSVPASYANAVKAGLPQSAPVTTSQGTPVTGICSMNPSSSASQLDLAASLSIVIDLTDTNSTTHQREKPGAVRKHIDDALAEHEPTKEIQCRGISRSPKDPNKFKVIFGNEWQAQTVRQNQEWLQSRFPGAKLQAEKWYPVRADAVCKLSVLDNPLSATIKPDIVPQIGNENGVTIRKLQWLSKADAEKAYGSMIVYLASRDDAVKLLREGMMDVDGETSFIRPFERRLGPVRCFKCH
jgi:hypothetical protein